ncbi:MAG: hypothetical protein NT107_05140 [Planctomycetota bacterium]|nr:hypothetical protein [Planctomycetota bacterium]
MIEEDFNRQGWLPSLQPAKRKVEALTRACWSAGDDVRAID